MQKIKVAIIKPFKLDNLKEALPTLVVAGLTLTEVKRFGHKKGYTEIYRGDEYVVNFAPKVKVEIVVEASRAGKVVSTIIASVRTGHIGVYGDPSQLFAQAIGTVTCIVFVFVAMYVFFKLLDKIVPLRVSPEMELEGLDQSKVDVTAYPEFHLNKTHR